jgi:hypothetical protein
MLERPISSANVARGALHMARGALRGLERSVHSAKIVRGAERMRARRQFDDNPKSQKISLLPQTIPSAVPPSSSSPKHPNLH